MLFVGNIANNSNLLAKSLQQKIKDFGLTFTKRVL